MAKIKFRHCGPDDPIYKGGFQVFVPVSRPVPSNNSTVEPPARSISPEKGKKKRRPT